MQSEQWKMESKDEGKDGQHLRIAIEFDCGGVGPGR
jgi:hypothetical protein